MESKTREYNTINNGAPVVLAVHEKKNKVLNQKISDNCKTTQALYFI